LTISKGKNPPPSVGFELFDTAIAPLLDYRQELPADLSSEEVRQKMRAKAEEFGVVFPDTPVLVGGQEVSPEWFLDVIEARMGGEADFELPDILGGYFWLGKIPGDGFEIPVIQVIMTPLTPRKEFLAKLDYAFRREFEPMVRMRPASLREAVRCLTRWAAGVSDKDIADELLSEEHAFENIKADSDAERDREYLKLLRRRTAKVRQFRKRFIECVTKVAGLESRE
jgi:hypothetical protein